jgi:hypothetical protein
MLRISDLAYGEQLVLWAARRWLADRSGWPRVAEEFALALGCIRARAALGALERILEALHGHARRTVYLHRLDCCLVSGDEHALLSALAALQAGSPARARAFLEWLLPPPVAADVAGPASCLAETLARAGFLIPARPRTGTTPVPGRAETGALLH